MSLQEFEDSSKEPFTLWVQDGYYFPNIMAAKPHQLKELQSWETREDDILLCTFPKSGTMWLWDIVSLLLCNQTEVLDRIFDTSNLEMNGTEKLDELPSPRVLQSHMFPRFIPKPLFQKRNKIIYGVRNPKDVAVSTYAFICKLNDRLNNYKGSWEDFLKLFQSGTIGYGSWFDHVKDWEKLQTEHEDYPILFVHYEDLHNDCYCEVKKIADFLELDTDDDTIHGIVQSVQFANFKEKKLKKVGHKFTAFSSDGTDPYFRKGVVGDWKNQFTDEQLNDFQHILVDKAGDSKIMERYLK